MIKKLSRNKRNLTGKCLECLNTSEVVEFKTISVCSTYCRCSKNKLFKTKERTCSSENLIEIRKFCESCVCVSGLT